MSKTNRKVLALMSQTDGPQVYVARAERLVVQGLEEGDVLALQCDGMCIIEVSQPGTYTVDIKDKQLHVRRVSGSSPVSVFLESDRCH